MSSKSSRKKKHKSSQTSPTQQTLAKWISKSPTQNLKLQDANSPKVHFKKENQYNITEENPFASSKKNSTIEKNKLNKINSSNHELPFFHMVKSPKQTDQSNSESSSGDAKTPTKSLKKRKNKKQTFETKEKSLHDAGITKKEIHSESSIGDGKTPTKSLKKRKNKNAKTKRRSREEPSSNTIIQNSEETVEAGSMNTFQICNNSRSEELTTSIRKTKRLDQTENKSTIKKRNRENSPNVTQNNKETGSSHESVSFQTMSPKKSINEGRKRLSNISGWLNKSHTTKKLKTEKLKKTFNLSTQEKTTKTLTRVNSASSDELPTFRKKVPRGSFKKTETFKKYGVIVPPIDEIIADRQHLSNYKRQVEEAQALSEYSFTMPSSPKKAKIEERMLDCKHLTVENIERHFNDNVSFLSDIMNGKKFSNRHRRYHNRKSLLNNFTTTDLTYSTSTIVFTFEQLDHMVTLMHDQFDTDDQKTSYFFKVLVPELCLKIFMDTYNMSKREANNYLDNRPV